MPAGVFPLPLGLPQPVLPAFRRPGLEGTWWHCSRALPLLRLRDFLTRTGTAVPLEATRRAATAPVTSASPPCSKGILQPPAGTWGGLSATAARSPRKDEGRAHGPGALNALWGPAPTHLCFQMLWACCAHRVLSTLQAAMQKVTGLYPNHPHVPVSHVGHGRDKFPPAACAAQCCEGHFFTPRWASLASWLLGLA